VICELAELHEQRDELLAALEYAYEMLEWHTDDDADPNDTSPEDAIAHTNGLVRQRIRAAIARSRK